MISIGLIGRNGSGKSSVCAFLYKRGFLMLSLSDRVRDEAKRRGLPLDRDTLMKVGSQLKEVHGQAVLAERSFLEAQQHGSDKVVFDSIRNKEEALFLKKNGVVLWGIDAPLAVRYERILSRKSATDHVDFETFQEQDEREALGISSGQNIDEAFNACDSVIQNDSTLDHLHEQLTQYLQRVGVQHV
jgi:dephospho-CoA kinase